MANPTKPPATLHGRPIPAAEPPKSVGSTPETSQEAKTTTEATEVPKTALNGLAAALDPKTANGAQALSPTVSLLPCEVWQLATWAVLPPVDEYEAAARRTEVREILRALVDKLTAP